MATSAEQTCSVCLTVAQDPRQVPCGNGHVFCLSCLEGLVAHGKTVQDNSFPCPCCRNRVDIPRRGVASFPSVNETGPSDSIYPSPRQRPKPSSAPQRFNEYMRRQNERPHFPQEPPDAFEDFRRDDFMGFPRGPLLPLPGQSRRMRTPFYMDRHDHEAPEMDSAQFSPHDEDHPRMAPHPFRRFCEHPNALSSILSGAQPSLSSSQHPGRHDHGFGLLPRRGRGRGRMFPRGPEDHEISLSSSSDDLDMEEVMLVIAQMEEEQRLETAEREKQQDEMLKMQIEINEQEDFQEALQAASYTPLPLD